MSLSVQPVSSEEQEQILQTVEMFEVIVQASPQDCQSMEILKEAYLKVGKETEALEISRRLADTYVELTQYSQAMFEYEAILQKDPGNPEVIAALSDLEEKLHQSGLPQTPSSGGGMTMLGSGITPPQEVLEVANMDGGDISMPEMIVEGGTLITTEQTVRGEGIQSPRVLTASDTAQGEDGSESLARFFTQHRLVPEEIVSSALERVTKKNRERKGNSIPISLIDEICRRGSIELETILSQIIDRSKFAYIPLEYYDVDRTIVKLLPEHLTIGRLMVPFDLMSRTLMIATANPFDAAAKETAQKLLDYNIQWHLASPAAISQVLASTYKVAAGGSEPLAFRLAS